VPGAEAWYPHHACFPEQRPAAASRQVLCFPSHKGGEGVAKTRKEQRKGGNAAADGEGPSWVQSSFGVRKPRARFRRALKRIGARSAACRFFSAAPSARTAAPTMNGSQRMPGSARTPPLGRRRRWRQPLGEAKRPSGFHTTEIRLPPRRALPVNGGSGRAEQRWARGHGPGNGVGPHMLMGVPQVITSSPSRSGRCLSRVGQQDLPVLFWGSARDLRPQRARHPPPRCRRAASHEGLQLSRPMEDYSQPWPIKNETIAKARMAPASPKPRT
jgi:hypothetical protein